MYSHVEMYKGHLLTSKQRDNDGVIEYKVYIHAKWKLLDETEWWADEDAAVFDAKGRIEQKLRDVAAKDKKW